MPERPSVQFSGNEDENPYKVKGTRLRSVSQVDKYLELSKREPEDQCEFFLKSFIFALGDSWADVPTMCSEFKKHAKDTGPSATWMNHIQAADFLQKHGKTRTGLERRKEVEDVDMDHDGQIVFVEYLLMHYKIMILQEYYQRHATPPDEDLSGDGVGICDVGAKLLEELFTMPNGLNPALELVLETFTNEKKTREQRVAKLEEKAALGGVKAMAAKNELIILEQGDKTEMNRIELTLVAAKRKASKQTGAKALASVKKKQEDEIRVQAEARRAKMKARAAVFEKK